MAKLDLASSANTLIKAVGKPRFIYGTAWKKTETSRLVQEALNAGFTAVDTAAQPKHYREDLVGDGLREVFKKGIIKREDIYLQTKFTTPAGQDPENMPYSSDSPLETQIHTSLSSSFHNLRPETSLSSVSSTYIDTLLLHSPLPSLPLTIQAWRILETYVPSRIRHLGISNVPLDWLSALYDAVDVKPAVVQNRFYPQTAYDVELRAFCRENGIAYESFWTLTGNPNLIKGASSVSVKRLAEMSDVSSPVALYALVMGLDVVVLNGTTSQERMREDLDGIKRAEKWSEGHEREWREILQKFRAEIRESLENSV